MIKDFSCACDDSAGISLENIKSSGLRFPDAYMQAEMMSVLAKAFKKQGGTLCCMLPFCHTVEAEAMGAIVHYGDERTGPRVKEYICHSLDDVLSVPRMDFSKGRIQEVLRACKILRRSNF